MDAVLAFGGLVAFIVSVIVLAAAVTWTVVRLTPARNSEERSQAA